ncbi:hypothetical protein GQ457_05G020440 [Hibiscus cannabinus]
MEEPSQLFLEKSEQHHQSPTAHSNRIPKPAKAEPTTTSAKAGLSIAHRLQEPGEHPNPVHGPKSTYTARTDRFIQKIDAFMDRTKRKLQNHDATLKSFETQVGQIS